MSQHMPEILIEDAEPFDLTPEQETEVERQLALAAQEEDDIDVRVNFRWHKKALETVKRAADAMGVGYQNYLKQVVYRQAVQDLQAQAQVNRVVEQPQGEVALQR